MRIELNLRSKSAQDKFYILQKKTTDLHFYGDNLSKAFLIRHNMMVLIIVVSVLIFAYWVFSFFKTIQFCKENDVQLRGILKLIYLGKLSWDAPLNLFFTITGLLLIASWLSISFLVYKTDHSFWIILYPILMVYFTSRYFLWFKEDLRELP